MDLLEEESGLDMSDNRWPICSRNPDLPAARIGMGATLGDSMLAEGCGVEGSVQHSVIFQGVYVGPGAQVADSLIMAGATVGAGTQVHRAVVAEDARIGEGCVIGAPGAALAVVGPGAIVEAGAVIAPGESVEPNAVVAAKA